MRPLHRSPAVADFVKPALGCCWFTRGIEYRPTRPCSGPHRMGNWEGNGQETVTQVTPADQAY